MLVATTSVIFVRAATGEVEDPTAQPIVADHGYYLPQQ